MPPGKRVLPGRRVFDALVARVKAALAAHRMGRVAQDPGLSCGTPSAAFAPHSRRALGELARGLDEARPSRNGAFPQRLPAQRVPLALGLAAWVLVAMHLGAQDWRRAALWAIGLLMGLALYHAAFGFASGYRRMLVARDMRGAQAQLLMLALATVLFAPVLAAGTAFGQGVGGAWAPVGLSVAAGAFLFGIGMQLAGGCGSGTLYTAGGGSVRMGVVLVAACAGSFWASLHLGWWQRLPSRGPVVLGQVAGWPLATAGQLALIAVLSLLLWRFSKAPAVLVEAAAAAGPRRWRRALLTGPWSLAVGAVVLALCNLATLLVAGHPWSITWGFTLWGAKAAVWLGWQPASSGFWSGGWPNQALAGDILADTTSMMDLAVMLGALCAAASAGRFAPSSRMPWPSFVSAQVGGLAIGYGARIAYGCNIGAFISGAASGSLHGWLWIAAALPGNWLGVALRRRAGLPD